MNNKLICNNCLVEVDKQERCIYCDNELTLNNRYALTKILGKNIGITYLAIDLNSNENVVIKELSIKNIKSWKDSELFKREYKALSLIHHSQIPKFIDYFEKELGNSIKYYTVMEHVEGKNLSTLNENYTDNELLDFIEDIGNILDYLHNLNPPIIHRDIKPSNIIKRSKDNKLILIDFDSIVDTSEENSTIVGTFGYMAPEQFAGKANVTSDYYSLGITALVLRTKKEPEFFIDDGINLNFNKVFLSSKIKDILSTMIKFDPKDRVGNFKELKKVLNQNVENIFLDINLAESVIEYHRILNLIDTNKDISILENLTEKEIVFLEIAINNEELTLDRRYINKFYKLYDKRLENQDINLNILLQYGNFYKNSKLFNELVGIYNDIYNNTMLFTIIMELFEKYNPSDNTITEMEIILEDFEGNSCKDIKEFKNMVLYLKRYGLFLKKNRKDVMSILELSQNSIENPIELEKVLSNIKITKGNEATLYYLGALLTALLKYDKINISNIISSFTLDQNINSLIMKLKKSSINKRVNIFNKIFQLTKKLQEKTIEESLKNFVIEMKEDLELEKFKKDFTKIKDIIKRIDEYNQKSYLFDTAKKFHNRLAKIPMIGVFQLLFYLFSVFFVLYFLIDNSIIALLLFSTGVLLHIPSIILLFRGEIDFSKENIDKDLFLFVAKYLNREDLTMLLPSYKLKKEKLDNYQSLLDKIDFE